jgi:pimeloyl-ACP methyl ester carboxylesterase
LILWGSSDGVIAPAYAQEFAQRIANSRAVLIERAGHLPHLEQAAETARLVRDFVNG